MNKFLKNKGILAGILVAVAVLIGGGIYIVQNQPASNTNISATTNVNAVQEITTSLQIDKGDGNAVQVYSVTIKIGETALDQLGAASRTKGFAVETRDSSLGAYVNGIDGVTGSANSFWLYSVNGVPGDVGAGEYVLKEGDVVEWKYAKS